MRRILPLLGLALAACGGGDGALSAEEFAKRGNAVCKAGDVELAEKGKSLLKDAKSATPEQLTKFFTDEAIPVAKRKLDGIDELVPPEADREKVQKMLASGRKATALVEKRLKEEGAGFLTSTGPDPFDDFNELAADLGLDDCAGKAN